VRTFEQEQTLSAAVSADLQEHVGRKYEAIVLRPALLDPMLHRAFVHSLQSAHDGYRDALMSLDGSVAEFVSQQSGNSCRTLIPKGVSRSTA
jgi:hypothetical protein